MNEPWSTNSISPSDGVVSICPPAKELFAGGGEMGAMMRGMDWSKTKLGPVEQWPTSLRTMLGVVLGSRFPMLLWWGPDLLHLYNDGYRPMLTDKHPASLGAPGAQVWAEIWDVVGPLAKGVQEGGPATWTEDLQLFITSGGLIEDRYFTFSYSPVPGDDGGVGGVLGTVQETTAKVLSERQIRMLHDLSTRAADAKSEDEAYRMAVEVLSANELDVPFVLLYALNEKADHAQLVGVSGLKDYEGPARPAHVPIAGDESAAGWPLAEVIRTAHEVVVDHLSGRFGPLPVGRWNGRPERAIVLPLSRAGQSTPYAFLVAGISPHRALDDRYQRFFRATADQLMTVIASARAYEAEKKRAEALAEIDRAKTTFFSNVSHEFRTPLTLILGPVEDALAQPTKSLDGENLQAVHRSAIRLLRLVNSLLDFARIEAGRLQMSFARVDLSSLTSDLASSFRSLVERAGMTLIVDCKSLPEPTYVDPSQWEKIVLNLISNAFKFTLRGEIAVSLRSHGDRVELTVRDTGTGIPACELPHIFERFHRVEGAKGRSFEGTGIGLSLVQELVKLHGGTVTASSIEGQGSTFQVSIPTGSLHLPPERITSEERVHAARGLGPYLLEASQWIGANPSTSPPGELANAAPMPAHDTARILIVDDNADMRGYLDRLLSARWRIDVAEDGVAALASARNRRPDLVLSDVMMPRMGGFALLRELRADPTTRDVPIVLLSARTGEESLLEGLATGADDYLVKPFSARELLARVQTHLDMARFRREWGSELERANKELEAFSYSVSHDLRAPLRAINGFSKMLLEDYGEKLDDEGRRYIDRVRAATQRMSQLIDDLLKLSRITRAPLHRERVDIADLSRQILSDLESREPERKVDMHVAPDLVAHADPRLIAVVLENLLGNSWKFTSKRPHPRIEIGRGQGSETVFFVRDNGAGFEMTHAGRLFAPFQRLHSETEFEGTGIGLATIQRIISRHDGRVWAVAAKDQGATFFFTLGDVQ